MKCPYCKKEMTDGFVSSISRGGICWTGEKMGWGSATSDPDFIQLSETPAFTASSIPASKCEDCKVILVKYEEK